MVLYRAVITPQGAFRSELQSDTFFGAFCWSYLRLYGTEALEQLLQEAREGRPSVIFSNAFPADCLPLPFGVFDQNNDYSGIEDKQARREAYRRGKKLKNAKFVRREAFLRIQSGDWRGFTDSLRGNNTVSGSEMHNMVLRDKGIVDNVDGAGNLFTEEVRFPDVRLSPEEQAMDVYVLSDLPESVLRETMEWMLLLGIGGDKSTGRGHFRLEELKPEESLLSCDGANGFVALSNFIPAESDPTEGQYRTLAKYPVLDCGIGGQTPFKKPLLFLTGGSVFRTDAVRPFYGKCMGGIAAIEKPVTVNACTIAIPMIFPNL